MPAGRPSTLTAEHVAIAREVAAAGGALPTIARATGTSLRTLMLWLQRARDGAPNVLYDELLHAIQEGQAKAEIEAIKRIKQSEEPRDAQWWLTHHPTTRDTWSDAAAERRAVRQVVDGMVDIIRGANLSVEQKDHLLLQMAARGMGAPVREGDDNV